MAETTGLAISLGLEMTALIIFVLMLHCLRRVVGAMPLYFVAGIFFITSVLVWLPEYAVGVNLETDWGALQHWVFCLPVLAAFLVVYEAEGTLEAQRYIFGMLILAIGSLYISQLVLIHYDEVVLNFLSNLPDYDYHLSNVRGSLVGISLIHLALLVVLPIAYQALRNAGISVCICLTIAMFGYLVLDELILQCFDFQSPQWLPFDSWMARFAMVLWVSIILYLYLYQGRWLAFEGHRGAYGIISELLTYIRSTDQLRRTVAEWEERYQTVFDNSSELIFLLSPAGTILNANRAAVSMLGKFCEDPGFQLASAIRSEQGAPFEWQDAWRKLEQIADRDAGPCTYYNMTLQLPDRKPIDIDVNLTPAKVREKKVALLIAHDITVQRNKERERQRLEEQLMHSQRLESIGLLAGGVAHDFNNLLHGIRASVENLEHQGTVAPEGRPMLNNISEASARAAALTSQLLGFARKGKYNAEILDLADHIQRTAQLFRTTIKDVAFKVICDPDPLVIEADATQLQQVILNLLLNAKDAVAKNEGERKIVLRGEAAHGDLPGWDDRPKPDLDSRLYVCLRVRDNGCGMTDEQRQHIFDPFYTTKPAGQGTGMGLAMVYGCVLQHHGWVSVTSQPNVGSEFIVFFPRCTK